MRYSSRYSGSRCRHGRFHGKLTAIADAIRELKFEARQQQDRAAAHRIARCAAARTRYAEYVTVGDKAEQGPSGTEHSLEHHRAELEVPPASVPR